ncbi:MAG: hypothetical protein LC623_01925 [Halobacteriales archaeon]|nr:hypothetical protein [Halobacteriales archaeon]
MAEAAEGEARHLEAALEVVGLAVAPGEDPVRAWARLPAGTRAAYVRFPRRGDLPLAAVQRLARRGAVIVDAAPRDADDVLDLAVAGAAGVVAWLADGGDAVAMADAMGDGFLLGCTARDLDAAAALAREHGLPLLVANAEPPAGLHGYQADLGAQPVLLRRFGDWPDLHPGETSDGGDAAGTEEGAAAEPAGEPAEEAEQDGVRR